MKKKTIWNVNFNYFPIKKIPTELNTYVSQLVNIFWHKKLFRIAFKSSCPIKKMIVDNRIQLFFVTTKRKNETKDY